MTERFSPVKACLFDMDGLLLDTERVYTEVTQKIVGRYGHTYDWTLKANMIGRPAIESATYLVDALQLPLSPQEYLQERNALLLVSFNDCAALPGAETLVRHLHAHRIPIAVATSSSRELYSAKTKNHQDWFRLFATVVTPEHEDVTRGKPAPDIFQVAADILGIKHADCLVFEDAPSGLAAGVAAGMQVIAIPDENMDKQRYKEAAEIHQSLSDFNPEVFALPAM